MLTDLLKKRRSIRKFTDKKVTDAEIREIIEAALYAPSGMGKTPWEFLVLSDPEDMKKAALAKKDQPVFEDKGSHLILVLTDKEKSNTYIEDSAIVSLLMQLKITEWRSQGNNSWGLKATWRRIYFYIKRRFWI